MSERDISPPPSFSKKDSSLVDRASSGNMAAGNKFNIPYECVLGPGDYTIYTSNADDTLLSAFFKYRSGFGRIVDDVINPSIKK